MKPSETGSLENITLQGVLYAADYSAHDFDSDTLRVKMIVCMLGDMMWPYFTLRSMHFVRSAGFMGFNSLGPDHPALKEDV